MADDDFEAAEAAEVGWKVRDAVSQAITGTDWAPPVGGVITDCVVILGWSYADGRHGSSHLICGTPWAAQGLVDRTLQRMEAQHADEIAEDD